MKTSRETLLEIGTEIVRRKGFGGLAFGEVASRAGIRKASLHHHFQTKLDFGLALIERRIAALEAEQAVADADQRRGTVMFRAFIRARREALAEGEALDVLTALAGDAAPLGRAMRDALGTARGLTVRRLAAILQTGRRDRTIAVAGDIDEEARALLAQIEGAELAARAVGDVAEFDRALATFEKRMSAY
ncbi:TetR/AcrR family transcriptional regulator [Tsuneonella sp. HG094]